jgi:acetyl-CoA C-acetyltransferase
VAVPLPDGGLIAADEQPARADTARIPRMKPAFAEGGTITAANASSISDGAAALVLARADRARALGLPVLARVAGHGAHAQAPGLFTTAPAPAIARLLDRLGWSVDSVDLFEVNEAFAVVALLAAGALGIPDDRLNIHGGATALGHPIGASGARIMVTLIHALQARGKKKGLATLCIGGGQGVALAIER